MLLDFSKDINKLSTYSDNVDALTKGLESVLNDAENTFLFYSNETNDSKVASTIIYKKLLEKELNREPKTLTTKPITKFSRINDLIRSTLGTDFNVDSLVIFFVGITPTVEQLQALAKEYHVIIIDTHKTAITNVLEWTDSVIPVRTKNLKVAYSIDNTNSITGIANALFPSTFKRKNISYVDEFARDVIGDSQINQLVDTWFTNHLTRVQGNNIFDAVEELMNQESEKIEKDAGVFDVQTTFLIEALALDTIEHGQIIGDAERIGRGIIYSGTKQLASRIADQLFKINDELYYVVTITNIGNLFDFIIHSRDSAIVYAGLLAEHLGGKGSNHTASSLIRRADFVKAISVIANITSMSKEGKSLDVSKTPYIRFNDSRCGCGDTSKNTVMTKEEEDKKRKEDEATVNGCNPTEVFLRAHASRRYNLSPYSTEKNTCADDNTLEKAHAMSKLVSKTTHGSKTQSTDDSGTDSKSDTAGCGCG